MTSLSVTSLRSGAALKRRLAKQRRDDAILPGTPEPWTATELALIDTAAAALDTALSAERHLRKHGVVINGTRGPKANPAAAVAQAARGRLMRALSRL